MPRLRQWLLAPRRAINRRRWVRRHRMISAVDRRLLLEVIIPAVRAEAAGADVLFVGVEWYTAEYAALFPENNFVTIDVSESLAAHGAPRHVTGDVRELTHHFEGDQFAAVICNGVVGFGLDDPGDVEVALTQISRCTRRDGLVVIGWNDTDELRVERLEETATKVGLVPSAGAGLSSCRSGPHGELRHIYDVYRTASARRDERPMENPSC